MTCSTLFVTHLAICMDPHEHAPLHGHGDHPHMRGLGAPLASALSPPVFAHLQVYRASLFTNSVAFINFKPNSMQNQHPETIHIQSYLKSHKNIQFRSAGVRLCGNMFVTNWNISKSGWGCKPLGGYPWMAPPQIS